MSAFQSASGDEGLVRAIGVSGLAATTFNIMIGGGIFVLPAVAAAALGTRAPVAYVICALAISLVLICFAEAGSRVSLTGGPYAYVATAFGPFAGFLSGVLLWVMAVFAVSAVSSALAGSAAVLWPVLAQPFPRAAFLVIVIGAVTVINIRGVRGGARLVELLAVVKLLPLFLFVIAGAVVARAVESPSHAASGGDMGGTVLVLIFAFAGSESALVPSGEVRDPARTVPRALALAMVTVMLLYIAVQVVAQRVLGASALAAAKDAPLAAAAARIAGPLGASVIAAAAVLSMFGNLSGMTLATPRALYALGRDGFLPVVSPVLARIHTAYRTPYVAILVQSVIVCALAVSSEFVALAVLANVSVLTLYLVCCAATIALRRRNVQQAGAPFRMPGAAFVPYVAMVVLAWILWHATPRELLVVLTLLVAAALMFVVTAPARRAARQALVP
ncbi:MAG TPA: APC family permease [Gemmatimonadaceae bacterium]|nr:APC family permease [Gemmatimonadaceae bacterium]